MSRQALHEHLVNAVKDAPPVAVGAVTLFGFELNEWVLILTAIYTIIRIVSELRTWFARKQDDRNSAVLANSSTDAPNK